MKTLCLLALLGSIAQSAFAVGGVGLGLALEEHKFVVRDLVDHSPAQIEGTLQINDEILAVKPDENSDWQLLNGLSIEEAVTLIRGAENTTVGLRYLSASRHDAGEVFLVRKTLESADLTLQKYQSLAYVRPNTDTVLISSPGRTDIPTCKNLCTLDPACKVATYNIIATECTLYGQATGYHSWPDGYSYSKI